MSNRRPLNARVDQDIIMRFRGYVEENKGRIRGELGREVERALCEYMDHDRLARIEENQEEVLENIEHLLESLDGDSHAHTRTTRSPTAKRTREVARRLQKELENPERAVLREDDHVERAITDIAGGDHRTHEKYKRELKERRLAFRHPRQPLWVTDADEFVYWIEDTAPEAIYDARRTYGKDWWDERVQELGLDEGVEESDAGE